MFCKEIKARKVYTSGIRIINITEYNQYEDYFTTQFTYFFRHLKFPQLTVIDKMESLRLKAGFVVISTQHDN